MKYDIFPGASSRSKTFLCESKREIFNTAAAAKLYRFWLKKQWFQCKILWPTHHHGTNEDLILQTMDPPRAPWTHPPLCASSSAGALVPPRPLINIIITVTTITIISYCPSQVSPSQALLASSAGSTSSDGCHRHRPDPLPHPPPSAQQPG